MPRRNFYLLLAAAVVSVMCFQSSGRDRHGRYFVAVLDQIDQRYLKEVDRGELFESAITGITKRLDKNSAFIPPDRTVQLREELSGRFAGIGVQVAIDPETKHLTVVNPIVGHPSPAFDAGVLAGDHIVAINGQKIEGAGKDPDASKLEKATDRLRGIPGEEVAVTVLRDGAKKDFTIRRAVIETDSVVGDGRDPQTYEWRFTLSDHPDIGFIRIHDFGERTAVEFDEALAKLRDKNLRGLILDLRDNGGGLLTAAVHICDQFLDEGTIVSTRGRDRTLRVDQAEPGSFPKIPLVVLVNRFSASASEIMAGCLQDQQRALVGGTRSYGKGTVQHLIPMEGVKSMLKLTTAEFLRPSGRNIHRHEGLKPSDEWGVVPDPGLAVKLDDAQELAMRQERRNREHPWLTKADKIQPATATDPQLKKALERLLEVAK